MTDKKLSGRDNLYFTCVSNSDISWHYHSIFTNTYQKPHNSSFSLLDKKFAQNIGKQIDK